MRLLRPLVAIALGLSLLVAGHASAAAKTCNILKDDAGDANDPIGFGVGVPGLNNANLDILGGDVGASTSAITGVIKLAKAPSLDLFSPQGDIFYLELAPSSAPNPLILIAQGDTNGKLSYSAGEVITDSTGVQNYTPRPGILVKGKVTGTSITMTVTLAALKPLANIKKGAKIRGVLAKSFALAGAPVALPDPVGQPGLLYGGDETEEALTPVVVGAKSCVVPVK